MKIMFIKQMERSIIQNMEDNGQIMLKKFPMDMES